MGNMYQQQMENFTSFSKLTAYSGVTENKEEYCGVTLVRNFVDHLLKKFDENTVYNGEENNDEDATSSDEDSEDDTTAGEIALYDCLKKKCKELYKKEDMIKIEKRYAWSLLIHIDLWKRLFNTIINQIIAHCEQILKSKDMSGCKYIFLVGGFANCQYFKECMKKAFEDREFNENDTNLKTIQKLKVVIPELPQLCVVDGAARYALKPNFMKIRRLSKTYGIKVDKLRTAVDESKFPDGYIEKYAFKDKLNNIELLPDCFQVFAVKNKPIIVNEEVFIQPVYKQFVGQTVAEIEIYESDLDAPMLCLTKAELKEKLGGMEEKKEEGNDEEDTNTGNIRHRGTIIVQFSKETEVLWVELNFSDTMLTVHAYPHGSSKSDKNKIEVDYV